MSSLRILRTAIRNDVIAVAPRVTSVAPPKYRKLVFIQVQPMFCEGFCRQQQKIISTYATDYKNHSIIAYQWLC